MDKVIYMVALFVIGGILFHNSTKPDYSKPWFTGTTPQQVCAIDQPVAPNRTCYTLYTTSNGEEITNIQFPNGGYITPYSADCYQSGKLINYGTDRFCRIYDSEGRQWEVDHFKN